MKRIYSLMIAIMAFTMVATAQESAQKSEKKVENTKSDYIYLGGAYMADFEDLDAGMYGIKIDRITPNGWDANMRILTNWGIKGIGFKDKNMMWSLGANYCPSASENHFLYIPILLSAIDYREYKVTRDDNYNYKTEEKMKLGVGLALEPSIMLRLGGLNLTAGVNINWFTHTKEVNANLVVGLVFELYKNR